MIFRKPYRFECILAFHAGRATDTFMRFPSASLCPVSFKEAALADKLVWKLTNPKPIEIPDTLSLTILILSIGPNG